MPSVSNRNPKIYSVIHYDGWKPVEQPEFLILNSAVLPYLRRIVFRNLLNGSAEDFTRVYTGICETFRLTLGRFEFSFHKVVDQEGFRVYGTERVKTLARGLQSF
jgi:hypothetical protein